MKRLEGGTVQTSVTGRHDPTIAPRFVPVAESMVALVLADALLAPPERIDLLFAQRDISPFFCGRTFFGSFANVISLRLHSKKPGIMNGRSECPTCQHPLSWYENIPLVAFFVSEGKSRCCKTLFRAGIRHRNSCLDFFRHNRDANSS